MTTFTPLTPVDCPAGQTARFSKTPAPTCQSPVPEEDQMELFRCFCPDGMFIKADGSCVTLDDCIGKVLAIDCSHVLTTVNNYRWSMHDYNQFTKYKSHTQIQHIISSVTVKYN